MSTPEDLAAAAAAGLSPSQARELESYHSYSNWLLLHRPQLESIEFPTNLYQQLYDKIYNEVFDSTATFELQYVEDEGYQLVVSDNANTELLKRGSTVWLIDHCMTFNAEIGIELLRTTPGLIDRLWKLMDMDRLLLEEEKQAQSKSTDTTTESTSSSAPSAASAADYISDENVSLIMQQSGCSRDRAIEALNAASGDLITAINTAQLPANAPPSELDQRLAAVLEQQINIQPQPQPQQQQPQPQLSQSELLEEKARIHAERERSTIELSESDRRAELVWNGLFKYGFVANYFTMKPRPATVTGPVKPDEIETIYYILDEIGSAIRTATTDTPTVTIAPLIIITLNGTAHSLLWLNKDLSPGDELTKPMKPNRNPKPPVSFRAKIIPSNQSQQ